MRFGFGDGHKGRDVPAMVEQRIYFNAALVFTILRPRKKRKAKADGGRVQAVKLAFEAKFVFLSLYRARCVHFGEKVFEKTYRAGVVGIGEGGTGNGRKPEVVELFPGGIQYAQSISHGTPCGKLDESHCRELFFEPKLA